MSRLQRDSSVIQPFCQAVVPGRSRLTGLATAVGSVALVSAGFVLPTAALQAGIKIGPKTEQTNGAQTLQQDLTNAGRRHSLRTSLNNASVLTSTNNDSGLAQIPQVIQSILDKELEAVLRDCQQSVVFQPWSDAALRESFKEAVICALEYRALATAVKSVLEEEKKLSFPPDEIRILMSWLGKERTIEYLQSRIDAHSPDAKPAPETNAGLKSVLQLEGKTLGDPYETLKVDIPMLKHAFDIQPKLRREFVNTCVRLWESQFHHMYWPDVSTPKKGVTYKALAKFYCNTACGLLRLLGALSTPRRFYSNYEQLKAELPAVVDKMFEMAIDALTRAVALPNALTNGVRSTLHGQTEKLTKYRNVAPTLLEAYFKQEDAKPEKVEDFVIATQLKILKRQTQKGKKIQRPVVDYTQTPTTLADMCMRVDDVLDGINELSSVKELVGESREKPLPVQSLMTVPVSTDMIEQVKELPDTTDNIKDVINTSEKTEPKLSVLYVKPPLTPNTIRTATSTVTQTLGGSKQ